MKKLLISLVTIIIDLVFIGVIVWGVISVPGNMKKLLLEKRIEKEDKEIRKESFKVLMDAIHIYDAIDISHISTIISSDKETRTVSLIEEYVKITADSVELGLDYAINLKAYATGIKDSLVNRDSLMNGENWKLLKRLTQNK